MKNFLCMCFTNAEELCSIHAGFSSFSVSGNDRFRRVRKQAELFYQGTHFRAFGSELCLGLLIHLQLQPASSSVCGISIFWMLFMQYQKFGSLLPECKVFSIVISLCCMLLAIILQ